VVEETSWRELGKKAHTPNPTHNHGQEHSSQSY
jgi:hypothetical protein